MWPPGPGCRRIGGARHARAARVPGRTRRPARPEDVPRALVDLRLELPGPPAGVPGEYPERHDAPGHELGGVSRSIRPTRDARAEESSGRQPTGSSWPGTLARPSALFGATGPPLKTTDGSLTSSVHGSSTRPTGTLVGRFSTTPRVPSSGSSSTTSTTVRLKLGSPSNGVATSSRPARTSSMPPFSPIPGTGPTPQLRGGQRWRPPAASRTAAATADATSGWNTDGMM